MAPRIKKGDSLKGKFCRCVKKVRKTIKLRKGVKKTLKAKESAAIGVCVKSVLQTKGRTLKRFRCGKKMSLSTQKPLKGGDYMAYQSTDPTASKIQPGAGIASYYDNALKAPLRL